MVALDRSTLPFTLYREPDEFVAVLAVEPRLESWDANTHPSQVALAAYLNHARELCSPAMERLVPPLAIKLWVGAPTRPVYQSQGGDLDNYLYPLVGRGLGWQRFYAAFAEKNADVSRIALGEALPSPSEEVAGWNYAWVETSTSASLRSWKEEIVAQLMQQAVGEERSQKIELQLAFRLAERRNWAYLCKPAIDSLGCILGLNDTSKPFHPRDDKVVRLGLHRSIDDSMRNRVAIGIWWRGHE